MHRFSQATPSRLLVAALCASFVSAALAQVSVRSVRVMGTRDTVEIEVEASDRIVPQTQVLTGPDRLVVDFPNATPGNGLRSQSVDRGEVKDVRVGLFQAKPPVTRVVLDLKSARSYQVFPYGRTVMIKVAGDGSGWEAAQSSQRQPSLVAANYTTAAEPIPAATPSPSPLQVTYRDGLLSIHANKATLSEVLYAVQQRTGADISIAAGAEQEQVVADFDPAPAPEVLARLLNGSKFNYLILSATDNPNQLDRVILTTRSEMGPAPLPPVQAQNDEPPPDEPEVRNQPMNSPPAPPPQQPVADGENKPADTANPNQ